MSIDKVVSITMAWVDRFRPLVHFPYNLWVPVYIDDILSIGYKANHPVIRLHDFAYYTVVHETDSKSIINRVAGEKRKLLILADQVSQLSFQ